MSEFDTFFETDMDETDPKAMCEKTWVRQQTIINFLTKQLEETQPKSTSFNYSVNKQYKESFEKIENKLKRIVEEMQYQLEEDYQDMERPSYDAMLYTLRNIKEILEED